MGQKLLGERWCSCFHKNASALKLKDGRSGEEQKEGKRKGGREAKSLYTEELSIRTRAHLKGEGNTRWLLMAY